jgi:drug/metabolite transporter (DMT)-like permease
MISYYGELAALGTSVFWTFTSLCFEFAAKRIGTIGLNILRLLAALVIYTFVGVIFQGEAVPISETPKVWFWLSLSGLVGFVFGDVFLFQAYIYIGARMTQLVFVTSPVITAVMGYFIFGETIAPLGMAGMAIVLAAIMFVVVDKKPGQKNVSSQAQRPVNKVRGIVFAVLAAVGQSGGLILSKIGAPDTNAMNAAHIRVIAGLIGFIIVAFIIGKIDEPLRGLKDKQAVKVLSLGALLGPFAGVSLALVAMQHTSSGAAATLMGLVPIMVLLPDSIIKKEKIRPKEIIGAVAAVLGAALIFIH